MGGYDIRTADVGRHMAFNYYKEPRMKPFYVSYSRKNGYYWVCERGVEEPHCAISDEGCPRSFVNRIRDALNIVEAAKRSANSRSSTQRKLTKD